MNLFSLKEQVRQLQCTQALLKAALYKAGIIEPVGFHGFRATRSNIPESLDLLADRLGLELVWVPDERIKAHYEIRDKEESD